jgi:hypothetical protein
MRIQSYFVMTPPWLRVVDALHAIPDVTIIANGRDKGEIVFDYDDRRYSIRQKNIGVMEGGMMNDI